MAKIITFSNQKGGSGKTTLSVNLAVLWSNSQYKVALLDADSQNSLSYWYLNRKKYYGNEFDEPRKKMAMMPSSSKLIYNPSSAAPGFIIKNVICLPGVPLILKSMIHNLKKYLKPGAKIFSTSINCQTVESKIARDLDLLQKKLDNYEAN